MRLYKILLVDDEERIRKGMKKLLEEVIGGYQVVAEASNGKTALQFLNSCQVDIIFTDIRMPEMDGIEFVKKARILFPKIPIIVLSGYDEYEYMRQAMKSNVTDYILKPVDRVELAQTLEKVKEMLDGNSLKETITVQNENESTDKRQIIRRMKELINKNIIEGISLQEIASELKYSYTHLSALFRNETGQSFSEYLMDVRIEKAKKLLKESNLKIYEVGSMCGYPNSKYFMAIFKEIVGLTPSEFRDKESNDK